jgi:hypothetical protein
MTKPDLTDEDYSDLPKLVREAIGAERIRIGPRIKRLRGLLAELDPHRRHAPLHPIRRGRGPNRASQPSC